MIMILSAIKTNKRMRCENSIRRWEKCCCNYKYTYKDNESQRILVKVHGRLNMIGVYGVPRSCARATAHETEVF